MFRARSLLCCSIYASVAALALVTASAREASAEDKADAGAAGASSLPACVSVTTDARYVPYGYNHVVILKNGCSKAATCSVSTNVNPQATSVEVTAATTIEVLTFTASPAQAFTARVSCKLH